MCRTNCKFNHFEAKMKLKRAFSGVLLRFCTILSRFQTYFNIKTNF